MLARLLLLAFLILMNPLAAKERAARYALVIHGGAGVIDPAAYCRRLASGGFCRRLVMTSVDGISSRVNQ